MKDIEIEAFACRLNDARERYQCELSFDASLDDTRDRLEIVGHPGVWEKYRYPLS